MKRCVNFLVATALLASFSASLSKQDAAAQPPAGQNQFTVPDGFRVEEAVRIPADDAKFSLVNMCFDAKGRLLVSRENGPILLCTEPDKNGVLQKVKPYCTQVTNCQGMCWVKNTLFVVGNGPQGPGLYSCRDSKNADTVDVVKLVHALEGDMSAHGPHAILHGPDGWLYLVLGNQAWAKIGKDAAKNGVNPEKLAANSPLTRWPTGRKGPDQDKAKTTEDYLLPRLNDPRGKTTDILAPGGTIWRMDQEGKNMSLVAAGLRNCFDAAFSPTGELFTGDSGNEADEGLPWHRSARIYHCPAGADFVWRTGSANTPDYYIDSLPAVADLGNGSPTGMEFYDHSVFPAKYRGALFMGDWSQGCIYAVHFQPAGGSYKANVERFCTGKSLNVTDLAVGPDGAIYFTTGGRDGQGSVRRIVFTKPTVVDTKAAKGLLLITNPEKALADKDAMVRRMACEALIRNGEEPPIDKIWPLLNDKDRFVRHAARLVLQRIDPKKWAEKCWAEANDTIAFNGIVALCHANKAAPYASNIFGRLHGTRDPKAKDQQPTLDWLRTIQLAMSSAKARPIWTKAIAKQCEKLFPQKDWRHNRELAILLVEFQRAGQLEGPVQPRLLKAIQASKDDRKQQIHYMTCMRTLQTGWTPESAKGVSHWYANTKDWTGGPSFRPYLDEIYQECLKAAR